jgi:4-hydroxy-tetrahydrodipicolinate synthase
VAEASTLPVILYNVPARTGSNMTAETTLRLAHDFDNIIGVKEAAGNFEQFNKILEQKPADFLFISGDDSVSLPLIAMGAVGIISVVANAIPAQFSNMIRLCLEGNFQEARKLHYQVLEFTNSLFLEGNPCGVKEALRHSGVCNNTLRLPLVTVSSRVSEKIKQELDGLAVTC